MRLIDTHTHLYAEAFDGDRDEMIRRAQEAGVEKFYLPNIDSTSIEGMLRLENDYPNHCFAMMGLHPCSVKENYKEELAIAKKWLDSRPFCAIGEIGIDLYWDKNFEKQQREAFLIQVEWAIDKELPIVIHSRESIDIIIDLLKEVDDARLHGVFHCFTGNLDQAEAIIEMGFLLGLGGVLTFKNSGLDKTVKQIDLKHVILETDSPYLTPTPHRGKRNESAYVRLVAEKLAEIKARSLEEIAEITSENAERFFKLSLLAKNK